MKNLRNIKFHTSASRRSLIQTGMATLYTIVSFFIVCISNSLTDVVNTNTYKRQEDREVLPDPLMQTFHHYIIEPMGASRLSGPALGNPRTFMDTILFSCMIVVVGVYRSRLLGGSYSGSIYRIEHVALDSGLGMALVL